MTRSSVRRLILGLMSVMCLILVMALAYGLTVNSILLVNPGSGHVMGIIAAVTAGLLTVLVFAAFALLSRRVQRVTRVAESLTLGSSTIRTGMMPDDDIGQMGHALDTYANTVAERQDELRAQLRKKRSELTAITAVLESLPDGVIVQDNDGRVILMNDVARAMLGSQRLFRSSGLHELTEWVTDMLGAALAPGVYALGNPQRIHLDERMLSAQAAAVMSSDARIGTVILLRDVSEQIRQEQQQQALIDRLQREVHASLIDMVQRKHRMGFFSDLMMDDFVRELTRHTLTLQKIIGDMKEVSAVDLSLVTREQKQLPVETLIWAVANEWRQVAQANGLTLNISIGQKGLFVLGDERRLRWALGNLVDNAIKYTPHGGSVTLELLGEENGAAHIRLRDTGVGISQDDMMYIFTRFYRGHPTRADGSVIQTPGMGQGLHIARQVFEAHGGTIRVRSKPQEGTAVYVSLPLTSSVGISLQDVDGETVPVPKESHIHESH